MLQKVHLNINIPGETGSVIVICHTPWERILMQWSIEHDFGLFISSSSWTNLQKNIYRKGRGIGEIRELVKHLEQKGKIIFPADAFDNLRNCPVTFLGNDFNASLTPARLASVANVPLIVAIPILRKGVIEFIEGPGADAIKIRNSPRTIIQSLIAFFEKEVIKNPSILPSYVK